MADEPKSVGDVLDRLAGRGGREAEVTVGEMLTSLGSRSYGPLLLVPPLIELSPIGGIPGVPTALAAIIVLVAAQIVVGRQQFWLPEFLAKRSVSADRLEKAVGKLRPLAGWLDRWFYGRLPFLTEGPMIRLSAVACILLALTVPPLELLPFASSAPMAAIAMFGLALLVHDGALMIAAWLLAGMAVAFGFGLLVSGG